MSDLHEPPHEPDASSVADDSHARSFDGPPGDLLAPTSAADGGPVDAGEQRGTLDIEDIAARHTGRS